MGYVQAAAAVGGLVYGVIQGERGASAQRKGLQLQARAQDTAEQEAMRQERRNQEDLQRASRRSPDIADILAGESLYSGSGSIFSGQRARPKLGRAGAVGV